MGDLTAKCDWHDSTLSIVLQEDPERIAVRLFDSRHAPARLYVPEADALQLQAENERLRELVRRMARALKVGGEWCDRDCGAEFGCDLTDCPIEREMRELGVVE